MRKNTCFIISLLYLAIQITCINSATSDCKYTRSSNDLHKFKNHVLRRRIRSLVFPNKAQLLLTLALTKAVLGGRPRGLSYSMEFDVYSPLPDNVDGWKPTIMMDKLNQKFNSSYQQQEGNQKSNSSETHWEDLQSHYTFDEAEDSSDDWTNESNYLFPNREFLGAPHQKVYNAQDLPTYIHKQPHFGEKYKKSTDFSIKFSSKFTKDELLSLKNKDNTNNIREDLDNQSDRERKQIFEQLEMVGKIFNFDIQSCLKRAICELSSQLRPRGESVIEDVLRIILLPQHDSHLSERSRYYGNNFNTDSINANCNLEFYVSCPYSILNILNQKYYRR